MTVFNTLYKYRNFNANTLSMLINRELYFASSDDLNDPYDCQISILKSIDSAIEQNPNTNSSLEKFKNNGDFFINIEKDIRSSGIFSLSKDNLNILMWSHYADDHKGLCVGFNLSNKLIKIDVNNNIDEIIGPTECYYSKKNPFLDYFAEFVKPTSTKEWEKFWMDLMKYGMASKSKSWVHENEVRIIKKTGLSHLFHKYK